MRILILIPALAILLGAARLTADPLYEMNWSGLDGGGGASQTGEIAHRGTLGGWLRRPIQSANYSIVTGYPHAPTGGSNAQVPLLSIVRVGQSVRISWPAWAANFVLESNSTMVDGSVWNQVPDPVQTAGQEVFVLVPASDVCLFYRLTLN